MGAQLLSAKIAIFEEEPRVRAIQAAPTADTGCIGITERGPIGVATLVQSFEEYLKVFGGYTANSDVCLAAAGFFDNDGTDLWVVRTVHYSDITSAASKTSAAGTLTIPTASIAATAGYATSAAGPFNLEPAQTLVVSIDAGGNLTLTFTATAAARASGAGAFALSNGDTLQIAIDGGSTITKTFATAEFVSIGAATAAEVVSSLNAFFAANSAGAVATVTSSTHVTITSNKRGSASGVNIVGGSANGVLGFTTGNLAGTGNVPNIDIVTATDLASALTGLPLTGSTVSVVGSTVKIQSNTTGASSSVQVKGTSTATAVGFDNAVHSGLATGALNTLRLDGKTDGVYANNLVPKVEDSTNGVAGDFNLSFLKNGVVVEIWPNVSMDDTAGNYVETILNDVDTGSNLFTATDLDAATPSPNDRPVNGSYVVTGGSDGLTSLADTDFIGNSASHTGIRALDTINTLRLLIIPGRATSAIHNAMITYCEVARSMTAFAILDCPASQTASQMVTYVKATALLKELSEFGAIYWPRVKINNPSNTIFGTAAQLTVAPSGHIAGKFAANDSKIGGIYEAPAGIEFGKLEGVVGLETEEAKDETKRDLVFPELINPITVLPGTSIHIDGARTLKSTSNFPTIGERRGVIFIETSIQNGLLFAKHRKIKTALLAQLDRSVRAFLLIQLRAGAFASDDPKKAYFVDFSKALNPPSEGFVRKVNGRIGLATAKPAEFIVIRVSQDQRALEEELAKAA